MILNLDPGACDAIVNFAPTVTDNCLDMMASATLSTLNAPNNGNADGGIVYFNITNLTANPLEIIGLEVNIDGASNIDIYTTPGTHVGNETNAGVWTLATSTSVAAGGLAPTLPFSFFIPPGTTGIAVHGVNEGQNYTNGTGANQVFNDGTIEITAGTSGNGFFTGVIFSPRVFNGSVSYNATIGAGPTITQTAGPAPGSAFPIGTTNIAYTATDGAGNVSVCSFNVTVNEFVATSNAITCLSLIHI